MLEVFKSTSFNVVTGFSLYGYKYDLLKLMKDVEPYDRMRLAEAVKSMTMEYHNTTDEVQKAAMLREVELLAIDALACHKSTVLTPAPRDPWNKEYTDTGKQVVCFSTLNGSIVIVHNDGGVHNTFLNHPSDIYAISHILRNLPSNWCYAGKETQKVWEGVGFHKEKTHCGHAILARSNAPRNLKVSYGRRQPYAKWQSFLQCIEDAGCTIWQLSQREDTSNGNDTNK